MNAIVPFAFEDKLVRTVRIDSEPWFAGKDVCAVLDISKHHQALDRLDPDERGTYSIGTPQGPQDMIVVSEAGVYRLVFTSRKPEAERFKRWLAHEVLPQLRRTGRYAVAAEDEDLPDEAISTLTVKLSMLREARMIFGPKAARELWFRLGLPAMPEALRPSPDADAEREARACLAHLLTRPTGLIIEDRAETWGDWIIEAFAGDKDARAALVEIGIRIEDDAIWVGNRGDALASAFEGTRWDGNWKQGWRGLPGAAPAAKVNRVDRVTTCGWSIPIEIVRAVVG